LRARLAKIWPGLDVMPAAANGLEALRAIEEDHPDVVFLDIRMPGLTGIELAGRIDTGAHVVFVTAYDQYAVQAFEGDAVDYLVKPVTDERLAQCVARVKRRIAAAERPPALDEVLARIARALPAASERLRWIRALHGEVVRQIPVEDVLYFKAADKYTCVITREGESLIRMPLAELAGQLDAETFWQIHRGTIVNMNEVEGARRDLTGRVFVRLKAAKEELAVSRAFAQRFKQM
jgi:DNA-binding LytR/AlgR family response regulator